ncbi:MAG: S8 family serine peptidase, partial [Holophagales bacterium]|nr:S8 family serine peptidase [Holophagales bacterium]
EVLGTLAPEAEITVYFAPNTNDGFLRALLQAIHDPHRDHSVISISWAERESSWSPMELEAMNQALHDAAALGITVCVSSGDQGASGQRSADDGWAHVEFPASSPFALACGGTRLIAAGDRIVAESVWHDTSGASGGGVSAHFPVPPYQQAAGVDPGSVNPGCRPGRGVPDVAGNADQASGYWIGVHGQLVPIGGTSAAAPLWAALVARLNEALGRRLGFATPAFYRLGDHVGAFRDIVEGNNANAAWVGGYAAGPGWDACSGWGSPDGEGLLAALGTPVVGTTPAGAPPARPESGVTTADGAGQADDLRRIEGIGPKIEGLLHARGIRTWAQLAAADPDRLRAILADAGPRYRIHDPTSWPRQARLAADGRWKELADLRAQLKGGRRDPG